MHIGLNASLTYINRPSQANGQINIIQPYKSTISFSTGDLLREERAKEGSEFGELIESHIKNGTIVPVEITCSLLQRAMEKSDKNDFLIDGFPRNEDNLQGWNKQMGDKVRIKLFWEQYYVTG